MVAWSTLFRSSASNFPKIRPLLNKPSLNNAIVPTQCRSMSHGFVITATRWQWHKTKDYFHFYFMLAAIPLGIITFCANVFVGPATLTPIPEGYEPKHYEYYRNPITRFLSRYIYGSPQKDYEKTLAAIWEQDQLRKIRVLEREVFALLKMRKDVKWGYFLPYESFHLRELREQYKYIDDGILPD